MAEERPEAPDLEEAPQAGTSFSTPSRSAVKANALRHSSRFMLRASLDEISVDLDEWEKSKPSGRQLESERSTQSAAASTNPELTDRRFRPHTERL
jgi:hypothetical protein